MNGLRFSMCVGSLVGRFFSASLLVCLSSPSLGELIEVAELATATQTSEWNGGEFPAENVLDGDRETFSHTDTFSADNHLEVQLDREYELGRIEVDMRSGCCLGRMSGAIVRIFDDQGGSVFSEEMTDPGIGGTATFQLPLGMRGRRVRIGYENGGTNATGNTTMVHLAEVRVFVETEPLPRVTHFTADSREVESGTAVTLSWTSEGATELRLYPGGEVVAANGSMLVNPGVSGVYELVGTNERGIGIARLGVVVDGVSLPLQLNEFLASNDGSLLRSDGSSPDWVEVWNPNPYPVNAGGYRLSDDAEELNRFQLGVQLVAGDGFLVIDASSRSIDGVQAAGFALEKDGGELIWSDPSGMVLERFDYPDQSVDISYGLTAGGVFQFFTRPTPGGENGGGVIEGFVSDTQFSVRRGFYQSAQLVVISSATPDAVIYYTTDGSEPGPENEVSEVYESPLSIDKTTVLRAVAMRDGWESTDIDTQTYLFASQVAAQSPAPAGFPQQWVPSLNGVQASVSKFSHFEMDEGVVASLPLTDLAGVDFELEEALTAIPTMAISMGAEVMFDPVDGLHVNAGQRGRAWERPVSFEIIDPVEGRDLQVNCGLRMHGGWNRFAEMLKKSFRLYFRSEYGDSKLNYPMFPGSEIDEFDRLVLRSGNGKAWASPWRALAGPGNSLERVTYLRDQIVRDYQAATGSFAIPGSFMHLYINGHYWGMYNPVERPTEHFAAARWGGDDEEYDVIKFTRGVGHVVSAGDDVAWNALINLVRGNVNNAATYEAIGKTLDLENFIDYIALNFFAGNVDWIDNNVYAMRRQGDDEPFRFYSWDAEESFRSLSTDITEREVLDTCMEIHQALRDHPEYRQLFADRVHRHFFNGGAFTFEKTSPVLDFHTELIDRAIVAESARWGALLRRAAPYDRDDWLSEVINIRENYLVERVGTTLNQLRNDDLYPGVEAPVFQPQHGGQVEVGTAVSLTADPAGVIYYTLDGSDPRLEGGAVSETALEFAGSLQEEAVIALGSEWKFLDDGSDLGPSDVVVGAPEYGALNWKHGDFDENGWGSGPAPLGYGSISRTTLNTEVSFGGDTSMRHRTTYFRKTFDVPNRSSFVSLSGRVLRDDGVVIYLNGTEVARTGFLPETTVVTAETLADEQFGSTERTLVEFTVPVELLVDGENVMAVELHQSSDSSSDLGFDLELTGDVPGAGGRINILGDVLVKSRVLEAGEWSALNEALFVAGDRGNDLSLSELMYHPADGGAEYLEITNRGGVAHSLSDLRLTGGIQFEFAEASVAILGPGEQLVLVRRADDFSTAYPGVSFVGDYAGALGNGGDVFSLEETSGEVLWTVDYSDDSPWAVEADGSGRSLIYVAGSLSEAGSWRPSVELGGNPGTSDRIPYVEGEDLMDYAVENFDVLVGDGFASLEVMLRGGADDAVVSVESSGDLREWSDAGGYSSQEMVGDGVRRRWQVGDLEEKKFLRLKVSRTGE